MPQLDLDDDWDGPPKNHRLTGIKWLLTRGPRHDRRPGRYFVFLFFSVFSMATLSFAGLLWSFFRHTLPHGGISFGDEEQDTSSPAAIVSQCEIFMRKNLLTGTAYGYNYSFNQPSSYKYSPSQWLWDSGAHQISWTALGSPDLAVADLRSMLQFQLDDGRIPQQINWRHKKRLTDPLKPRLYSNNEYNDLTQMPVLPYSLRSIYEATGNVTYLRELVPPLVKYFRWWKTTRDLDSTGVVTILHPWESGLDLTPAYDPALGVSPPSRARPMWSEIYPQLIQLALSYRWRYSWDHSAILSRTEPALGPFNWFKVQDIAVNCVYASGWGILGDLASKFDESLADECYANQNHSEAGILSTLFSKEAGHFVTGYKDKKNEQRFHAVRTVQMLFPLLLSRITSDQVSTIVEYLTDATEFWTEYPIPSVSRAEPEYNAIQNTDLLWRGPTWGFTNWFVMEGLHKHGQTEALNQLMDRWIAMAEKGGIWEMNNPQTAVGYGAEGLGMSVLIVDWMKRLDRV